MPTIGHGTEICTSTTRPASPAKGMQIFETDTNKIMVCSNATGPVWKETNDLDNIGATSDASIGSKCAAYTWTTWNPTNVTGTNTNASSTSAASYNDSSYITFSNTSGTLTITFATAGKYLLIGGIGGTASNVYSHFRGDITVGGTATKYYAMSGVTRLCKGSGDSAGDQDWFVQGTMLVSATANQTITLLPAGDVNGGSSTTNYIFYAGTQITFIGT